MARWSVVVLCFSLTTSRSLFAISALLIFLGLILQGGWKENWGTLKKNQPALLCLFFVGWIYLSSLWTHANESTLAYSLNVHWKLLLVPAIVLLIVDERWKRRCWMGYGLGAGLLLAHIYAMNFVSIPWISGPPDGVFFNPLPQSVGLAIFSALCLSKLLGPLSKPHQLALGLAFVAASYAVLSISQQRLGYLMWGAGLMVVVPLQLKPLHRKWGLLMAFCVFLALFLGNQKIQDRFGLAVTEFKAYNFENNYTSVGARLHMWYVSIQSIKEAPMLGHGIGSYPLVAEASFQDDQMCALGCGHPHNQYLFYTVEFGLIGLSLFLLMLHRAFQQHRSASAASIMPLVVLVVFVLSGLVESTLWYRGFMYLFVPLLALSMLSVTERPNDSKHLNK